MAVVRVAVRIKIIGIVSYPIGRYTLRKGNHYMVVSKNNIIQGKKVTYFKIFILNVEGKIGIQRKLTE